jgi:simple sugar transport system permease protein
MFQVPELGLLALAMVIPLISGGLNLAIIATTNQCALLMAFILTTLITPESGGAEVAGVIALALVAGFLLSLAIGLVTGFLVANMGVHPILVTLGTMSVVNGVSIWLTRGTVISGFPPEILWIGNGVVAGIPVSFLLFLLAAVAVGLFLTRTPLGIGVYMVGSNPEATRYSGVDVKRVLIGVYTLSSVLCFVAAVIIMARFNSASAGYAQSYLLVTILAAVLGGINPMGGFGKVSGLVLALIMLQIISSAFNLLNFSAFLTLAIWGGILIAVAGMTQLRQRLKGG